MATFPDESHLTGVWRVMPVDHFPDWLAAQKRVPASIRYIVDHHTYSPASAKQTPATFLSQVKGIFRNYYEVPKAKGGQGWARDHGPQLHLGLIGGKAYVVVAANLWVPGPHCANFNSCSVGIETYINGDTQRWPEEMLRGLYVIHSAFRTRLGIPLRRGVTGAQNTNMPSATGKGWLFHRDAKASNKSCPGRLNTHAALQAAFDRFDKGDDMFDDKDRAMLKEMADGVKNLNRLSLLSLIDMSMNLKRYDAAERYNTEFYQRYGTWSSTPLGPNYKAAQKDNV